MVTIIGSSLLSIAMLGVLFILPVFLQNELGLSPLQTGLLTLPGAILTAILMPISGILFDKIGARPLGLLGLLIMLVGTVLMVNLNIYWTFGAIMLVYMFRQAGMGLAMMPISTAGMNDVPFQLVSRATALQNTMRNVAGSIGTAYLSTIMQTQSTTHFVAYAQRLSMHTLQGMKLSGSMPSVYGATSQSSVSQLVNVMQGWAFQRGMQQAFIVAVMIGIIAWVAIIFIGKKPGAPVAASNSVSASK